MPPFFFDFPSGAIRHRPPNAKAKLVYVLVACTLPIACSITDDGTKPY
ncbi:hypothetical protein [Nostoc sp. NMS7]|nr:hypothetical protein [Nostoc sp. NMS7]